MDRRRVLATTGLTLATPLVGCLGSAEGDTSDGGVEHGGSSDGDDGTTDEAGTHHLYLVNLDDETRRLALAVTERNAAEPVLEGTYNIPAEKGAEFREVAAWEQRYDVAVTVASGLSETFCWETGPCPGPEAGDEAAELPGGSRNASVRVEPGGDDLSFVTDSCDAIVAGTAAPTGPAQEFEREETD